MNALSLVSWVPLGLYLCAATPQFITNYRRKNAKGVSHWMLFLRVSSGMFYIPYLFLCSLPWSYQVAIPMYVGMLSILAYQGYKYEPDPFVAWRVRSLYQLCALIFLTGLIISIWNPLLIGNAYGWIGIVLAFFCEWPQLYRNWQRKSVVGLNFWFLSCIGMGGFLEVCIALWFGLPPQTLYSALRASSYYLLYCFQFLLYSARLMR